jgi:ADP-heptose:LPS heptosyltransferase
VGATPRSLLLIRPDHLGDVLFLTPALHALRERLPETKITLLVGPWGRAAIDGNPDVDAVVVCPFPGFERGSGRRGGFSGEVAGSPCGSGQLPMPVVTPRPMKTAMQPESSLQAVQRANVGNRLKPLLQSRLRFSGQWIAETIARMQENPPLHVAPYRLLFATAHQLRAGGYDAAVVLRFDHWWGAWLAAAAGIPRRIGYDWPETQPFLTQPAPYRADRHEVIQNAGLLAMLETATQPESSLQAVGGANASTRLKPRLQRGQPFSGQLSMPGVAPRRMKAAEAAPMPPERRAWEPDPLFSGQMSMPGATLRPLWVKSFVVTTLVVQCAQRLKSLLRRGAFSEQDGAGEALGPTRFAVTPADRDWAAGWLTARGVDFTRPLVAIHPGAGAMVKQWPPSAWAATANRLAAELSATILLTGAAAERSLTAVISAQLSAPALDASGQTTLGQLAALYERCALVLGADSGPLHLAVAVGAPTVHLYGPVDPAKFGPWGDPGRHVVLTTPWPCAPCNRLDWPAEALPQHACMAAIGVDDVVRAACGVMRTA